MKGDYSKIYKMALFYYRKSAKIKNTMSFIIYEAASIHTILCNYQFIFICIFYRKF